MRKILIATIAGGGMMTVQTSQSIDQAKDEGRANGWEVRSIQVPGTADIANMRNQVIGIFLNTTCDDLLLVDADVAWGAGTFAHIMTHKVDFVAGLYRERTDARVAYPVRWPEKRRHWVDPLTGLPLLEADRVPAGFLRLSRSCVEKMGAGGDVRWMENTESLPGTSYPFLFDWTWRQKKDGEWNRESEDFTFCRRWREIGGTVWVDPALKLNHVGQKVFGGDYMAFLQLEAMSKLPPISNSVGMAKAALAMAGIAA